MLNNKGFTVIELVLSFAFVSVLSVSLFAVVINYREKQQESSIETKLLSYKSKLIVDVQNDIQKLQVPFCTCYHLYLHFRTC